MLEQATRVLGGSVEWLRLLLEAIGALTIAAGAGAALVSGVRTSITGGRPRFTAMRFELSRYLALALEFQLAADILETAIAPEWNAIGHLAAIATIRTALNYFLARELAEDRRELAPGEG
jgi:uncharacterized membrane protein